MRIIVVLLFCSLFRALILPSLILKSDSGDEKCRAIKIYLKKLSLWIDFHFYLLSLCLLFNQYPETETELINQLKEIETFTYFLLQVFISELILLFHFHGMSILHLSIFILINWQCQSMSQLFKNSQEVLHALSIKLK